MSPAKQRIYDAIAAFWKKHGYSPTLEEIAEATGVSSIAPIWQHVKELVAGGYLAKTQKGARRSLIPLPLGKGEWNSCDQGHRIVLYQGAMCPVCQVLTMQKVNDGR